MEVIRFDEPRGMRLPALGMVLCVSEVFLYFGCFVVLIVSFCKRVVPQL